MSLWNLFAQPPTPQPTAIPPEQFERIIQALERGAITADANPIGGLIVVIILTLLIILVLVWRRKEPTEVVNPALANVIAKYDERMDDQQVIIADQRDNQTRFLKAFESLTATQETIQNLLRQNEERTDLARERVNTMEKSLQELIKQGSQPLQQMANMLKDVDVRTKLMSETQLANIQAIVESFEKNLVETITEVRKSHETILQQLDKRRTDSRPIVPPEMSQTITDGQTT